MERVLFAQLRLHLVAEADEYIEALLDRRCPVHPGTTVDYGVCDLCVLTAQPVTQRRDRHPFPAASPMPLA